MLVGMDTGPVATPSALVPAAPAAVLLVEPDDDNREMYGQFLTYSGFRGFNVSSADEALPIADKADVIVTDVRLPGAMDGLTFVARLRGDERTRHIPIIVLTACVSEECREGAVAAGCNLFLQKPCLPDVLVSKIQHVLNTTPLH